MFHIKKKIQSLELTELNEKLKELNPINTNQDNYQFTSQPHMSLNSFNYFQPPPSPAHSKSTIFIHSSFVICSINPDLF